MQYINLQIFLGQKPKLIHFSSFLLFLACHIAIVVCIRVETVIGQWLLSSAGK
jgi:hypothetical protein